MPERPRPQATFRGLTGLRFLAAAHVVWFHAGPATGSGLLDRVQAWGWTAVNLFFVLSGFVLAHRYPRLATAGEVRAFLRARLARVFPAHALALVAMLGALALTGGLATWPAGWTGRPLGFLAELLLLHAWLPFTGGLNLPDWTLSVELAFYALFPLVLPLVRGRDRPPLALAAACVAASSAASLLAHAVASGRGPLPPAWFGWVNNLPLSRLPAFVLGVALARWVARPAGAAVVARHGGRLTWVGAAGTLGLMAALAPPWPALELVAPLLLPFQASLVIGLAGGRGAPGALLGSRPLERLGEWSYGVYLYQVPVLVPFAHGGLLVSGRFGSYAAFAGYALALVAASGLLFHLYEDPARRALRGRRAAAAPGVAAAG